ncbi:MAG: DEAD/DEAH box helicase [Cyclobacteriaceae bacterium]|nr:DEAD/DEAH box helicase [Cyclobacteriaceae bacterium]
MSTTQNFRSGKRTFTSKRRPTNKRNSRSSSIDVKKLVNIGRPLEEANYKSNHTFSDFPMHELLLKNIEKLGYTQPTEIQEKTFLPISELKNVIGIASTGTGKTASFLMPIINGLLKGEDDFQTMILVPTRELALQVEQEFIKLSRGMSLYITSLIGGSNIRDNIKNLRRFNHIIVGTPGRVTDLVKRGNIKLAQVSVLVLDEFDRMLDMGFSKDVEFLTSGMVNIDQTLLFSATIDPKQKMLIQKIMTNPVEVKVSSGNIAADHITQEVVRVSREQKLSKLIDLINDVTFEKVIVFAETKINVSKIAQNLKRSGVAVDEIHGDKTQGYRQNALRNFKSGRTQVLVATDVAARGLDISNVTHVINYEIPRDYETYIHRIGRTGRAGKTGMAFTFVG